MNRSFLSNASKCEWSLLFYRNISQIVGWIKKKPNDYKDSMMLYTLKQGIIVGQIFITYNLRAIMRYKEAHALLSQLCRKT